MAYELDPSSLPDILQRFQDEPPKYGRGGFTLKLGGGVVARLSRYHHGFLSRRTGHELVVECRNVDDEPFMCVDFISRDPSLEDTYRSLEARGRAVKETERLTEVGAARRRLERLLDH